MHPSSVLGKPAVGTSVGAVCNLVLQMHLSAQGNNFWRSNKALKNIRRRALRVSVTSCIGGSEMAQSPIFGRKCIFYAYDSSPLPQISKHVLPPRLFHLSRMLTMSTLSAVPKESTICTRIKCKTSISHTYSMQIKRLTFFRPSRPGGMRETLRITWISSLLKQIARVNPNWFNIFHANKYVVNLIS